MPTLITGRRCFFLDISPEHAWNILKPFFHDLGQWMMLSRPGTRFSDTFICSIPVTSLAHHGDPAIRPFQTEKCWWWCPIIFGLTYLTLMCSSWLFKNSTSGWTTEPHTLRYLNDVWELDQHGFLHIMEHHTSNVTVTVGASYVTLMGSTETHRRSPQPMFFAKIDIYAMAVSMLIGADEVMNLLGSRYIYIYTYMYIYICIYTVTVLYYIYIYICMYIHYIDIYYVFMYVLICGFLLTFFLDEDNSLQHGRTAGVNGALVVASVAWAIAPWNRASHKSLYANTFVQIYGYIYIYTHTNPYMYIHIHIYIYMYICIYMHTCIHAYMHRYIDT